MQNILKYINKDIKLHDKIVDLFNQWKADKESNLFVSDIEKLCCFRMLYSDISSQYHFLENKRKVLLSDLYIKYNKESKTQKQAENLARIDENYQKIIEEIRYYEKYKHQLYACVCFYQQTIEKDKANQYSDSIEKRLTAQSGEGRF